MVLTTALKSAWEKKLPFVFYRLPDKEDVLHFQQQNTVLHDSTIPKEGFVIAPFDSAKAAYRILADYIKTFNSPQLQVIPKELNLPPEQEKANYLEELQKAMELLRKERLEKLVLSRPLEVTHSNTPPYVLFEKLLTYFPNALVYFWHHPKIGTWLGASPEQFLNQQGDNYTTMALAGTMPMSSNIKWTEKEYNEQQLVVNAIVEVVSSLYPMLKVQRSATYTKQAGNLAHLNTDIAFKAAPDDLFSIAKALHPTPAVGGVPRQEALSAIRILESYDRTYYSGFLGPVSEQQSQLFVNLRCMQWQPQKATLFVGGGITAQSEVEAEWMETQRKASILYNLCLGNL